MRLRSAAVLTSIVAGTLLPCPAAADGNRPPVAVDDPAIPACVPIDHWGGSFPIVEDLRQQVGGGYDDWFMLFESCLPTANDSDPDGDPLTLEVVGQPEHGEAVWIDNVFQMLGYKADADWSTRPGDEPGGTWTSDLIAYRVSDGIAWSNVAVYRFWVAPINDPPTFASGPAMIEATAYGGPVSVPWATAISPGPANESDQTVHFEIGPLPDGDVFAVPPAIDANGILTFTPGSQPGLVHVTVTAQDDGGLEDWGMPHGVMAEPPDDTSDPVTFDIVVNPPGPMAPIAVDDDVATDEDEPVCIDALHNDVDPNGDPMLVTAFTDPGHGAVDWAPYPFDQVCYTPDPDVDGSDSFDYTVEDPSGRSAMATVRLTIRPVNDAPTATDDSVPIAEDSGPISIDVLAGDTDVDGDPLSVTGVTAPAHGTAMVGPGGGDVIYTPDADSNGTDSFAYTLSDGTVSDTATVNVAVHPVNDAPVLTLGTDRTALEDAGDQATPAFATKAPGGGADEAGQATTYHVTTDNGALFGAQPALAADGTLTWTPAPDANGIATVSVCVADDGGTTNDGVDTGPTETFTITVTAVNDNPTAVDDTLVINEVAGAAVVNVLDNDTIAPDTGETLSVTAVGTPAKGSASISGDGTTVTYTPGVSAIGDDSISYTISDGSGGTDVGTISVTINPETTPPVVGSLSTTIAGGRIGRATVPLRLGWSADDPSGIGGYEVEERLGAGAWLPVALASPTSTAHRRNLPPGIPYAWRVRAIDALGNVSAWTEAAPTTPHLRQEAWASIAWRGTWWRMHRDGLSGGRDRWTRSAGRRVTVRFTGSAIAWIGRRAPTAGSVGVWVDGRRVATISGRARDVEARAVLFATALAPGSHRLQLRVIGNGRVDVDAFVILP